MLYYYNNNTWAVDDYYYDNDTWAVDAILLQ